MSITDISVDDVYLPFVVVGAAFGVETVYLPASDEGVQGPVTIPTGFPFGSSVQNQVYVSCINPSIKNLMICINTVGRHKWNPLIW